MNPMVDECAVITSRGHKTLLEWWYLRKSYHRVTSLEKSINNGCVQHRNQLLPRLLVNGPVLLWCKNEVMYIRQDLVQNLWLIYEVLHHLVPIHLSSHFMPTAPFPICILTRATLGHSPFPSTTPGTFPSWCLCSTYSLLCNAFLFLSIQQILIPCETYTVKPSWLTYPDSSSLIPLLCHYIMSQLFVCMSAFVLRQGAPWKLVLIFWCLSRIGKKCKWPMMLHLKQF